MTSGKALQPSWSAPPVAYRRQRPRRQRTAVRLWLPITPLFVILAPLAMAAAPLIAIHPAARRFNPWRVAWIVGGVLLSLGGTRIDIETPTARIRIHYF